MLITNTDTEAQHPWPEGCYVQGGARGIVFAPKSEEDYYTAFVEAFPRTPPTFLRGEGDTIEEAEDACWKQYMNYISCQHPSFTKGKYINGCGHCIECGTFFGSDVTGFEEETVEDPEVSDSLMVRVLANADPNAMRELLERHSRVLEAEDSKRGNQP